MTRIANNGCPVPGESFGRFILTIPLGINLLRVARFIGSGVLAAEVLLILMRPSRVGGRQVSGHLLLDKFWVRLRRVGS